MILQNCVDKSDVVPLTSLDKNLHIIIFGIITPLIGSIIAAVIFARFLAPLFIKAKNNLLARDYEDAFISEK
ncbi:MAG: hypothetical protein GF383_00180 [Candidatus Lokiarchaeota archaeon]|nr:hypothetical protein [Candidatus Lokiarchaeota archaeon]MBD3337511.1 hypothetical protein [Candidatus Lokiarchaeota archaeon]